MSAWSKIRGVFSSTKNAPPPAPAGARGDGWVNELTGHGVLGVDKTASTTFDVADDVSPQQGQELWTFDDLCSKIVEKLPEEMTRAGYEVCVPDDKQIADDAMAWAEDTGVAEKVRHALKMERALGGCAILPAINDGASDLAEPLNEGRIMEIGQFAVFGCHELRVESLYDDVFEGNFGSPKIYRLQPTSTSSTLGGVLIHESRLIVFPGIETTRDMMARRAAAPHWGFSVLARCARVVRDYNLAWASATSLLSDFSQTLIKIKGLGAMLSANNVKLLRERLEEMMLQRSSIRAVVVDAEENFERQATPVTGMPDLLDRFQSRLGAAADTPVSILFGDAPGGLNATGQADRKTFQDSAAAAQATRLLPRLTRLFRLYFLSTSGPTQGREPDHWRIKFHPLEQLTSLEEAGRRKIVAETDQIYFNIGLSTEEIISSRFGADGYSAETVADLEARDALDLGPAEPEPSAPPTAPEVDAPPEDERGDARRDRVEKRGRKWVVTSMEGVMLGEHATEAEALAQLRAIEAAKARRAHDDGNGQPPNEEGYRMAPARAAEKPDEKKKKKKPEAKPERGRGGYNSARNSTPPNED